MSDTSLHLAIVPDGNRRWARSQGWLPWRGHEKAMENFEAILDWCMDSPRIGALTIWGFSTENWKRSKEEIAKLMELFERYLLREQAKLVERKVRFVHSGRLDRIPQSLASLMMQLTERTKDFATFTFHVALDYGGRDEVVRAVRKIGDASQVTEESIRQHLDQPGLPDIDLIIRTSGEQRTSNFCLWQSAYAEWFFVTKHFPELKPGDIEEIVREFSQRQRRYGGG